MAIELNVSELPSRLEMIQAKRLKMVEKIEKEENFEFDENLGIRYLETLRDIEKQELYKHKASQDKDEGDKNRQVAARALEIQAELRRQRRSHQNQDEIIDHDETIPTLEQTKVKDVEVDQLMMENLTFKQSSWTDFQKDMIRKGLDPNHYLDEEGNVQKVKRDE